MGDLRFKIWRILEEQEARDGKHRVISKKEFTGEIENPKQEIYLTSYELVERYAEGYYLVEVPAGIYRRYLVPEKQYIRTPGCLERSGWVVRDGAATAYVYVLERRTNS